MIIFPLFFGTVAYCPSIFNLQHCMTGIIPDSFCGLAMLADLNISNCCLTGECSVCQLFTSTLVLFWFVVDKSFNSLTGLLLPIYLFLASSHILIFSPVSLLGHLPHHIGRMRSLTNLQLFNNQLVGALPESLGDLSRLELMNLCNNHFKGRFLNHLYDVCSLYRFFPKIFRGRQPWSHFQPCFRST